MKTILEFQNLKDEDFVNYIVLTKNILVFNILYKRFEKSIYIKILGFLISVEDAKRVVSSFFLALHSDLKIFNNKVKFSHWLYFRLYLKCITHINKDAVSAANRDYKNLENEVNHKNQVKRSLRVEVSDFVLYKLNKAMHFIAPKDKALLLVHQQEDIVIKELQLLYNVNNIERKQKLRTAKTRIVELYNNL